MEEIKEKTKEEIRQEFLDEYSVIINLLKNFCKQTDEEKEKLQKLFEVLKIIIKDFSSFLSYQIDMINETTDIFHPLLLDLNTNFIDSSFHNILNRQIYKEIFNKDEIKGIALILKQEIVKQMRLRLIEDIETESLIEKLKKEIIETVADNEDEEYEWLHEKKTDKRKLEITKDNINHIFFMFGRKIQVFFDKDNLNQLLGYLLQEKISSLYEFNSNETIVENIFDKYVKKRKHLVYRYWEDIYKNIVSKYITDYTEIKDNVDSINNQNNYINEIINKMISEISEAVMDVLNNQDKILCSIISSEISSNISHNIFDKISTYSVDFKDDENFWNYVKEILEQQLAKYLDNDNINKISKLVLSGTFFRSYRNNLNNLQEKMSKIDSIIVPLLEVKMEDFIVIGNLKDFEVLKSYSEKLKEMIDNDELTPIKKPLIFDTQKFLYIYGELRRAYLDYKNYINNILKRNIKEINLLLPTVDAKTKIELETRKIAIENIINQNKYIFLTSDMILFLQNINSKYFSFMKSKKIDASVKIEFNDYYSCMHGYLNQRIRGVDLFQSNNPDVVQVALDYSPLTDSERTNHSKISIKMKKYILKIRILELCYKFVPLLEETMSKLSEEASYIYPDADIDYYEILEIKDKTEEIEELFSDLSLFVDIDLRKNDENIEKIKKLCVLISNCLKIIEQTIKNHQIDNFPLESSYRTIEKTNNIIYLLTRYYYFVPEKLFVSTNGTRSKIDADFFTRKYDKYCTHEDFSLKVLNYYNLDEDTYLEELDYEDDNIENKTLENTNSINNTSKRSSSYGDKRLEDIDFSYLDDDKRYVSMNQLRITYSKSKRKKIKELI